MEQHSNPLRVQHWFSTFARFLSTLLKSIWLFFPAILFIFLTFACFISLSQGKDILISFVENTREGKGISVVALNFLIKFTFFISIAFWAYVSWYSSRIVAYGKLYRQKNYARQFNPALPEEQFGKIYEIQDRFLAVFPRLMGYGCFIIILFAIANLLFKQSWVSKQPILSLIISLMMAWYVDSRIIIFSNSEINSKRLRNWFGIAGIGFIVLFLLFEFTNQLQKIPVLFGMAVLLMVVYMLYINLRRKWIEEDVQITKIRLEAKPGFIKSSLLKAMDFIHLDKNEYGYFLCFNIICLIGFAAYVSAILFFKVSVAFGPMPLVLLSFAVLLGFGNGLTSISVKTNVNIHFIIFLFAAIVKTPETHFVRTAKLDERHVDPHVFSKRPGIQEYFNAWIRNHPSIDSSNEYPVYFVLGNGGASRSAYWVASVLGRLEDQSIRNKKDRFSDHIFCLSGTSGGGVGVASFYAMLKHANRKDTTALYEKSAKDFLRQDFLSYTLSSMLGPDYFNYIPGINLFLPKRDRVYALERAFEKATDTAYYPMQFNNTYFDECIAQTTENALPILCINSTRVQDGNPAVVCSIRLDYDLFNKRVDVAGLLSPDTSIRLSSAAILGARFPYLSPAGRIDQTTKKGIQKHYFVDGGYFDNSGAGIVQEMIRAMIIVADTTQDSLMVKRMKKLKLVVLHITNSPQGNAILPAVSPFSNDLTSPLLTILGAYDMQTTVNDMRLADYIADINQRKGSSVINRSEYLPIHLYNDPKEPGDTLSNGPYAMNWFISDSVRNQMDRRLLQQPKLNRLLKN